ncbi:metallophosphoesterase family protein [soil metagenome]
MRIAVISDIHGNLVALDAVLDDLARERYDELICLGDVALRGPQPVACLERVRELGCPVVMGNTDEWLLTENPSWRVPDADDPIMVIDMWCAEQLTAADREVIRTFQAAIGIGIDSNSILFYHGSPRSNTENILSITPEIDLETMIGDCRATALVGGHTHLQMVRRKYEKTIVNVGSVGLPFLVNRADAPGSRHSLVAPWAEYAVIDFQAGRLSVDLRRVPIDLAMLERVVDASGMPKGEWWLSNRDRRLDYRRM